MPAGLGKKIHPDDLVEISPDTVRRQEHGFIRGVVRSVSEIPATEMAMIADLKHKTLVTSFLQQYSGQVLLSIRVQLRQKPDEKGRAVLDWSSVSGMKSRVQRGRRQLRDMLEACCVIALDRRRGVADYDVRNQQNNLCRDRPDCGALDTREK